MRSKRTPALRLQLAWVFLFLLVTFPAMKAHAESPINTTARTVGLAQLNGVLSSADGQILLAPTTGERPRMAERFERSGTLVSPTHSFPQPITRLKLTYTAQTPSGTQARLDVRGSTDGQRWLPWLTDLPAGAVVNFDQPIRAAEYRVALAGGYRAGPRVSDVGLAPTNQTPTVNAATVAPYAVAPTFRVRATRVGMVGGRTANGFVIPPRARFVALPAVSVLSTRGRDEYQVRLTYQGRSTVVPVYDVGPYNEHDDYWNAKRSGYPDLDQGWPMDHAAFYEGYNGGRSDKGVVRFPTAVDVGDGAWLDALGIVGDKAELEVTYLWLGQDPLTGPPTRDPAATEHVVDELGGDFWHSALLAASNMGCGNARHASWATGGSDPATAPIGRWQPQLPVTATYEVFVHIPVCPNKHAPTTQARYAVQHRDGAVEVLVNQQSQTGWVSLGRFPFTAGTGGFVQLAALAPKNAAVWFDQVKWVRVP